MQTLFEGIGLPASKLFLLLALREHNYLALWKENLEVGVAVQLCLCVSAQCVDGI
jgi:hypothetical protein